MNDDVNQQILIELRKSRRLNQIAFIVVLFLLAISSALETYSISRRQQEKEADSWYAVRTATEHAEYDKARAIAEHLTKKNPEDYYGYSYLGNIALATGRLKEAESNYVRAAELLPSEENEKAVQAIRKRMERESSKPSKLYKGVFTR